MTPSWQVAFGPFRLDVTNERLWKGLQSIPLRPKAFAVLRHLVERPGQLVTKQQLLEAVWPATFVSDAVLKDSIRQVREALGDDPASPRYIETAHRRGYRFVAQISDTPVAEREPVGRPKGRPPSRTDRRADLLLPSSPTAVLGREAELARLRGWLEKTLHGDRQVVFVTGEPGIGKTTIVNALLEEAAAVDGVWISRGQCLEQYGASEAYLPVLDGLSRLARTPGGERIVDVLRQHAPAWLLQLPALISLADREALHKQVTGATRERMLREIADAIETLAASDPLILVLEDLHWSDRSTLDLIGFLARRRDPARLLIISTYRPVEVILGDHPLKDVKRELLAHGLCQDLPLEYLTEEAVTQYLDLKAPGLRAPRRLARLIHRRTEGNPLFMVNLVEYLIHEQVLIESQGQWHQRSGLAEIESGVPENIKELIEKQIERLTPDERTVLEGASVVGLECSSVAIGAGLEQPTAWVEERCEALVRRYQFLSPARLVELPDGTITPRYKFHHVLYLEVPYGLLAPMRRAQIHRRIGQCGEAIYGDRVNEIAAELAMHFEQGRDTPRAVRYLLQAADNAAHRSAQHEAAALARRGLQALGTLPETPERIEQELRLRMILGVALMATKGFAAAEVEEVCNQSLQLCAKQVASPPAFMVRWLFGLFHYFRGEMEAAHQIAGLLVDLAKELEDPVLVLEGHRAFGVTLVDLGRFDEAMRSLDRTSMLYDSAHLASHVSFAGQDPKVVAESYAARALWALGYPDRALDRVGRALSFAQQISHAESSVVAMHSAGLLHQLRGEPALAQERSEMMIALADEHGLELWSAFGSINRGWARVEQGDMEGGIDELQRGLTAYQATGAKLWRPYSLGLLAQALSRAGRNEDGLSMVTEALSIVQHSGEDWATAELLRIKGELLIVRAKNGDGLSSTSAAQAEKFLNEALSHAARQTAKSWELRIVTSLGRLYEQVGRRADARRVIDRSYSWFSEGFDTRDAKAAKSILERLAPGRAKSATSES
jgi:DNA-binding winged helix-turn-helix (wHTH) protein/predicted ATPase